MTNLAASPIRARAGFESLVETHPEAATVVVREQEVDTR